MRLLCVDDEPGIRSLIKTVAEECGFEVELAANTAGIAETWHRFAPDVIVLDLSMPDSDGIEGLSKLAAAKCTARIILISGSHAKMLGSATRLAGGYELNVIHSLNKPFRAQELRRLLRAQVDPAANRGAGDSA